jgi:hypothetical protein
VCIFGQKTEKKWNVLPLIPVFEFLWSLHTSWYGNLECHHLNTFGCFPGCSFTRNEGTSLYALALHTEFVHITVFQIALSNERAENLTLRERHARRHSKGAKMPTEGMSVFRWIAQNWLRSVVPTFFAGNSICDVQFNSRSRSTFILPFNESWSRS